MLDWPFWAAGFGMLVGAGLKFYSAFRTGGGAHPSAADRLRRRAGIASGSGASLYGAAMLYHPSYGPARVEVFIAGSIAFTFLALAGIFFSQRARDLDAGKTPA